MTDSDPTVGAAADAARLDPDHLLHTFSLALGDDEVPTDAERDRAKELLRQPGALAYAYTLIDVAVRTAMATGQSLEQAERYTTSPLATLLDTVCEEAFDDDEISSAEPTNVVALQPTRAPKTEQTPTAANDDDDGLGGGAKIIRLFGPAAGLLAAAAAVIFFVQSPKTDGPGVKGGPPAPPISVQIVARDGPLTEAQALAGLDTTRKNVAACQVTGPAVVDIGFAITGNGVVDTTGNHPMTATVVQGKVSPAQLDCLQASMGKAAFAFQRDPTLVMMRLEVAEPTDPSLVKGAVPSKTQ